MLISYLQCKRGWCNGYERGLWTRRADSNTFSIPFRIIFSESSWKRHEYIFIQLWKKLSKSGKILSVTIPSSRIKPGFYIYIYTFHISLFQIGKKNLNNLFIIILIFIQDMFKIINVTFWVWEAGGFDLGLIIILKKLCYLSN